MFLGLLVSTKKVLVQFLSNNMVLWNVVRLPRILPCTPDIYSSIPTLNKRPIIVLRKLEKFGIFGELLRWIESYLTNCSQAVVIGRYRPNLVTLQSGVPQGSLFGPLLHNAHLYDVYTCFTNSQFLMYADDTKSTLMSRARKTDTSCR